MEAFVPIAEADPVVTSIIVKQHQPVCVLISF